MSNFAAGLFLSGFGRDREREADLFASLFLQSTGSGDTPLRQTFEKLKFARDTVDPLGTSGSGAFATHPHIEERLARAKRTTTNAFPDTATFHGLNRDGDLVAILRLDAQRIHERDYDVVATLTTTAELGDRDTVNSLTLQLGNDRVLLREATAESVFPSDEVSAVFGATRSTLIEEPIVGVSMRLKNVDRWIQASEPTTRR
jgi:hypothetical protein